MQVGDAGEGEEFVKQGKRNVMGRILFLPFIPILVIHMYIIVEGN